MVCTISLQFVFDFSGKIGYGTVSEALAYKIPLIFVRRDHFNEEPFLRSMFEVKICTTCNLIFALINVS